MDVPMDETDESAHLDPKYRGAKTHETVEALLNALLDAPTVLIIEDAHWVDEASYDLTKYLGAHGEHRPWVVMTIHRQAEHGFAVDHGVNIQLGPLSEEESTELAQVLLGDAPMLASRLRPVVQRSGGNPLFLTELVNAAVAGGNTEELPDSVEALVLARIDGLDPLHRKLLRYASVVGTSFDTSLIVSAMADLEPAVADPESWHALDEFVVERSKGDMRFRQQLFHDVAYTGLPYRSRRLLHERVGRALEQAAGDAADDAAERLSLHFLRAEVYDKAWHYSVVAGDGARAKFGNVDAIEFYRRALRAGDHLALDEAEVAAVAETLGDVAEVAGMYDEADHAFGDARKHTEAGSRIATRLMRKQGLLREKRGVYPQALRWFSRALSETSDTSPASEAVEVRLSYAGVRYRQGKYRDTFNWASEALADAEKRDDLTAAAHAHRLLGLVLNLRGDVESLDHLRAALKIYEENDDLPGQADSLTNLGRVDYRLGKWDLAVTRWEQCMETRRRLGDVVSAAMAENNVASVRSDQGHWDDAAEMFHRVRRVLKAAGHNLGVAVVTSNLGRAAARAGRFDEAHEHLDGAINELEGMGAEQMVLEGRAHLAEAYLFAGHAAETETVARGLLASIGSRAGMGEVQAIVYRVLGYAQLLKGDAEAAGESFVRSLDFAGEDYEMALTLEAIAQLPAGSTHHQPDAMEKATEIFDRLGVIRTPDVPLSALVG
jgi:tetratricopeptide (TPR) repeat protein